MGNFKLKKGKFYFISHSNLVCPRVISSNLHLVWELFLGWGRTWKGIHKFEITKHPLPLHSYNKQYNTSTAQISGPAN